MLKGVLRYLGMDEESKRKRAEMEANLRHADAQLDLVQAKLDEYSRVCSIEKRDLDKALTESDFGGKRTAGKV